MKRLALVCGVLGSALVLAAFVSTGTGWGDEDRSSFSIGLWGDVPYSETQQTVGVPNLIADMNRERLAFSVYDGDIKGESGLCDDALYTRTVAYFNSLHAPAMYTPGDNEWTDCDRANNGAYDSFERLTHIRTTMFATPYSFGQRRLRQQVQAAPYVENRRWHKGEVTFATLDVPGSNNNLGDVNPDPREWAQRNAANLDWMHAAFASARTRGSQAVMLVMQADPGFNRFDSVRSPPRDPQTLRSDFPPPNPRSGSGFDQFLIELRAEVIEFAKPVVLVHGDSHYFRVDKPLLDRNGHRIEHFTRVETPGDHAESGNDNVQWVEAVVDAENPDVFAFEQKIVGPNLQTYTP